MTTATPALPLFPTELPSPSSERWWLEHKTQIFRSPLSGQEQRIALNAARWRAELTFPYLKGEEARQLAAFCARLQGARKGFRYRPAHHKSSVWIDGAQPLVANPPQWATGEQDANKAASTRLRLDLVNNLTSHRIEAGDSFSLLSEQGLYALHIVVKAWQAPQAGTRFATIDIAPPLRFAPTDGALVELDSPQASMRLQDDRQARLQWLPGNIVDAITLQLVEVL